ncbi:MAG: hypothetical protein IID40_07010 [Planctomycetes bacterium]|nr:hypothetical protein [Planctomycetota bacterium]
MSPQDNMLDRGGLADFDRGEPVGTAETVTAGQALAAGAGTSPRATGSVS